MARLPFPLHKPMEGETITVSLFSSEYKIRLWIGMRLVKLAGWFLGAKTEVKEDYAA